MSTPEPITSARLDELHLLNPDEAAPPLKTTDGHESGVGAAHGRVLPMIGQWRPYLIDVTVGDLLGKGVRIYADTSDDAVALLVGGQAPAAIAEMRDAWDNLGADPTPESDMPTLEQNLLEFLPDVDDPAPDAPELTEADQAAYDKYAAARERLEQAQMQVAAILTDHATGVRVLLQQQLNAAAVESGQWSDLDDDERDELEACSREGEQGGRRPFGIGEQVSFYDEFGQDSGHTVTRGEWRAEVPLACLRTDYLPFTGTIAPLSVVSGTSETGVEYWVPGDPNLVWLDPSNPDDYLESLAAAGLVDVTERPVDHPLETMRPWLRAKRERDLARARAEAVHGEP